MKVSTTLAVTASLLASLASASPAASSDVQAQATCDILRFYCGFQLGREYFTKAWEFRGLSNAF